MIITNLLYHKNHHFLEENGNLSLKGLKYLAQLFYQTIHTVSDSGTSKAPYKIFHDGDFGFLYTK
ncbi:MAG: hypothetical protein LBP53_00750 [Candidatus Peribacteria bacterium]|jgi:hypothetical protein|nr:hypothetical protein [Candidatus Peribacteria bacterium]